MWGEKLTSSKKYLNNDEMFIHSEQYIYNEARKLKKNTYIYV